MKKHYILLGVALLVVVGLAALAINKYEHRASKPSYSQVATERTQALIALKAQESVNANDTTAITNLKATNTSLTAQQATLCAQIRAARLVQPICK